MSQSERLRQEIIKFRNEYDDYKMLSKFSFDSMIDCHESNSDAEIIKKFSDEYDENKKKQKLAYRCICELTKRYNKVKHQEVMGDKS